MNTRHFSGMIKPIPQQACGPVERASSRQPVQDAQSAGSAVRPSSMRNWGVPY